MTDVWKSLPKHFCKFCKCWIADNKSSRDFHEKGKRHQENVAKKITEVRKSATKRAQQEDDDNSYMKEMEKNARKAFLKDLKRDPSLVTEIQKKKDPVPNHKEIATKTPAASTSEKPNSATPSKWHEAFSPEGHAYYWNELSSEVTWVKPEGCVEKEVEKSQTAESKSYKVYEADNETEANQKSSATDTAEPDKTDHCAQASQEDNITSTSSIPLPVMDIPLPASPEQTESKKEADPDKQNRGMKRANTAAYGSWEQIKEEEYVDLQLPEQEAYVEEKVVVVTEPKFKFKEKKVNSLGADLIAFKKRKQATRNLKQKTTDS